MNVCERTNCFVPQHGALRPHIATYISLTLLVVQRTPAELGNWRTTDQHCHFSTTLASWTNPGNSDGPQGRTRATTIRVAGRPEPITYGPQRGFQGAPTTYTAAYLFRRSFGGLLASHV